MLIQLINGPQPDFMQKPLKELDIGTYSNIATVCFMVTLCAVGNMYWFLGYQGHTFDRGITRLC